MKKQLFYFFDVVMKDETTKKIIIKGWGVDAEDKKPLQISVEKSDNILEFHVESTFRQDINTMYQLSSESKTGFTIIIKVAELKGRLKLFMKSGEYIVQVRVKLEIQPKFFDVFYGKTDHVLKKISRVAHYLKRNGLKSTIIKVRKKLDNSDRKKYLKYSQEVEKKYLMEAEKNVGGFKYTPCISILVPVYNVEPKWLQKCIDSVKEQFYPNWELCLADDASTDGRIKPLLEEYAENDSRIKIVYREKNGHICEATNSALDIAGGEFVGLLDNDDTLPPNALYEVIKVLNENPEVDLIYSDEDKIDKNEVRSDPTHKPEWSPDLLLGTNYISHFGVYRTCIAKEIGGFRKGFEGAQDHDFVLRFTEETQRICRIPKILYHWRMLETSTAANQSSKTYAYEAGVKAIDEALKRRGIEGTVKQGQAYGLYAVDYKILKEEKVSVIIPTRDGVKMLKTCVDSVINKTLYKNYEIIIVDNGSVEKETLEFFKAYKEKYGDFIKVLHKDIPFNYSTLNNYAAEKATGKYLLFLNNDTEVISENWMNTMVSYCQFDRIGVVGAKLIYPDETVQHSGIIMGLGGVAGHCFIGYPRHDFGYFGRLSINPNYLAVTAACMMVKESDFSKAGGFEEALSVAFNDVDLGLKIRELGKDNVCLNDVELYHYESKSRGKENTVDKQIRFSSEEAYMQKKWGSFIENDPYYNPNLTLKDGSYGLK